MRSLIPSKATGLMIASLALAAATGVIVSTAVASSTANTPTRTVTVDLTNGAPGPPGPPGAKGDQGPPGPAGDFSCVTGYEPGILVINHPGGHVKIYTCLEKP